MFRFTIRDVIWLTVVAALALSWWRSQVIANERVLVARQELQQVRHKYGVLDNEVFRDLWRFRAHVLAEHMLQDARVQVSWKHYGLDLERICDPKQELWIYANGESRENANR